MTREEIFELKEERYELISVIEEDKETLELMQRQVDELYDDLENIDEVDEALGSNNFERITKKIDEIETYMQELDDEIMKCIRKLEGLVGLDEI